MEEFFFKCETVCSYSAQYVKEYIGAAKPLFSVGECWDSCNYNGHGLDYNQGFHNSSSFFFLYRFKCFHKWFRSVNTTLFLPVF